MADAELNIKVSTTHTQEGAAKAEAAIKTQTAAAVKGAKAATDATNKWSLSKKALTTNLTRLTKEFPLLGAAGRLALNPILLAAAGAAWAFKSFSDRVKELDEKLKELQKTEEEFHAASVETALALKRASGKELSEFNRLIAETATKLPTVSESLDTYTGKLLAEERAAVAALNAEKELSKIRIQTSGMSEPEKELAIGKLEAKTKSDILKLEQDASAKRIAAIELAIKASEDEMEGSKKRIKAAQDERDAQTLKIAITQNRIESLKKQASQEAESYSFVGVVGALTGQGDLLKAEIENYRLQKIQKQNAEAALPKTQAQLTAMMSEAEKGAGVISTETARVTEHSALKKKLAEELSKEEASKAEKDASLKAELEIEKIKTAQQQAAVLLEPDEKTKWIKQFEYAQKLNGLNQKQMEALLIKILSENQAFANSLIQRDAELESQRATLNSINQKLRYMSNIGIAP